MTGFMVEHGFETLRDFIGTSLPYFSTHFDLVERQRQAKIDRVGRNNRDFQFNYYEGLNTWR